MARAVRALLQSCRACKLSGMATSPGDRFGRLVALQPEAGEKWAYRCDCGSAFSAFRRNVEKGLTRSCGCLRREVSRAKNLTHGQTAGGRTSPTMKAWSHAKARCYTRSNKSFPDYGARGIRMCDRWRESFSAFLADMGECPPGLTLDRIDMNGHYEPGNCRWADRKVQNRNKRNVHMVEVDGEPMSLPEAAEMAGLDYQATYHLIVRRGRSFAEARAALGPRG